MSQTIDLRQIEGDTLVVHFGGRPREVDLLTYGRSLLEFSELLRAINNEINPGTRLDVLVVAEGPGSFRVKLRFIRSILANLLARIDSSTTLSSALGALVAGILLQMTAEIFTEEIEVDDNSIVISRGETKIVLPREVYQKSVELSQQPEIQNHVQKTFEILDADPSIDSFGLTANIDDEKPAFQVDRGKFELLATKGARVLDADHFRTQRHKASMVLNKIWLDRSKIRKWQVVWNGFPISVTIHDDRFFDRLARREIMISQGDALNGTLAVLQEKNDITGAWENKEYRVEEIDTVEPPMRQDEFFLDPSR